MKHVRLQFADGTTKSVGVAMDTWLPILHYRPGRPPSGPHTDADPAEAVTTTAFRYTGTQYNVGVYVEEP